MLPLYFPWVFYQLFARSFLERDKREDGENKEKAFELFHNSNNKIYEIFKLRISDKLLKIERV